MNHRWIEGLIILMVGVLGGCSSYLTSENPFTVKPPDVLLEIRGETYETVLGSHCWGNDNQMECVDTTGPPELVEGEQPIKVQPGESITFLMDYDPKPNEVFVTQIDDCGDKDISISNNRVSAPKEEGIYYYAYSVWWKDEKEPNLSHGDAMYAFAIEVE